MPATSTIPLDDLPGAPEHGDALFAFSVHGLGGSKIAANKSLKGMMASEVAPPQQQQQKEAPKKGWLSSLNTAVVGERQEVVTLMLTLSASEETSATPAAGGGGMPGMPAPPALARRSTGDRPLSVVPARSAMLLAGGRPNTPTVFYQSEHRTFGQQPVSPAAVSRSASPSGFPDGGGEGGVEGGKQRPMTMSEEGIVHFSIPARVPGNRGSGTNGGGDGGGGEETMVVFVVELWQVVNRSRRALWGSLTLSWDNLMAVPTGPRKCGVFSGLQSERYPTAFLAVRRVYPPLPRPLSMSPRGVSNPAVEKFNPMVTFFTAIRRVTDGAGAEEDADWFGGASGFGAGGSGSGDSGGSGGGDGGVGSSLTASAEAWELVVCQELAVEGKYTFKIPLQFLFPVHNSLKHAALAWRARARKERHRQGLFSADEEAFAHGMVVVHVSVSRARGLGPIAAAAAATAATAGAPQSAQLLGGGADAGGGGATSNNPGQASPVGQASSGTGGGREGLPAAGGGRGGLVGLGIEGAKVSSSMRAFGGRMKGMGVKAVAMARIASQASPAAHLRLGAVSSEEKILRQANFFVKVVYGPPLSANSTSDDDSLGGGGGSGSGGLARPGEPERVVGVTNTEYGSVEPVWGANANLNACPYNAPRDKHQVSGATRLDVVSDITDDLGGTGGSSTTVGTQGEASSGGSSSPSSLAFTFYVPAKHLEAVDGGGGSLRLHLCQNMFSLKAGIVDAPVGYVTIPLCGDAGSTVHSPEWRDVEAYSDLSVGGGSPSGGVSGDLLSEGEPRQGPPQVLVGVSIQARKSSSARPGSPGQRPLAFSDASSTLGDGPAAYGSMLGDLTGGTKTGGGGTAAGSAVAAAAMARRISLGSGEWTKVVEDSDSDEEVADEGTAAAAAAAASTTSMRQHLPGLSENLLSKTVSIRDCYGWMDLIGGPSRVLDTAALVDLFAVVHYPLTWVESHAKGISDQVDRLARVLEVYTQRVSEGGNFRSSLLKKEPLLQYVATNLHIQVWSIRDPATGKDRSYDFVTTGAPTAHALGHVGGGLVTLQEKLQALGMKVLELQGSRKECKDRGGVKAVTELEGITDNLRTALLEYEVLGGKVSIRRACVVSQAISIAATSFCAKLEMMARGTLDVASDRTTGGCGGYDELAERWVSTGFLLGFEGLLSIHGKEHGMVEDTVSALDMLADYNLKVVSATLVGTDPPPLAIGKPSPVADDPFELEIGVEGNTIQCIVGDACLPRLPRALWDGSSGSSSTDGGGGGGGRAVRIVPVLFTQGIDIQQSMTHAARDAREKAAFQADINSQNLARLNRYCHRVCPVKAPTVTATPGPAGSSAAGGGVAASSPGSISPLLSGGMPPLPRPRGSGGGLDDLLGLGEMDVSGGGTAVGEGEGGGGPGASVAGAMGQQQTSVGASVPEWMHPALSELETAVRDDKVAHKNTAILLEAQVAVRRLCGGRVTFCKSGKDRTAMSITLEEALLLAETASQQSPPRDGEFGVEGPAVTVAAAAAASGGWRAAERSGALADANVLRAHGARLLVAEKNIGRPLYSFNALQRQFIPELYQPPPQTIQDVITSALNRDS